MAWSAAALLATFLVQACGGGGGSSPPAVHLEVATLAFRAIAGDSRDQMKSVQVTGTGDGITSIGLAAPPGYEDPPPWLSVSISATETGAIVTAQVWPAFGPPSGVSSTRVRVIAWGGSRIVAHEDLTISLETLTAPTVSPDTVALNWIESEEPSTSTSLSAAYDPRIALLDASIDADWLSLTRSGDTLTLAGNAQSREQAPGLHTATLTVRFALDGRAREVPVPVTAQVGRALSGPAGVEIVVTASSTAADLSTTATISTTTQAEIALDATSDVAWLDATGGATGTPGNLALAVHIEAIRDLANGSHSATVTLTPTSAGVSPLAVPVTLTLQLPQVDLVAPVAFTDTADTDHVIVRGQALADPGATLRIDGAPATNATVVSDTEVHLVPGAHAAGDHMVDASNLLGLARPTATLRMAAPPAYSGYSMATASGLHERVLSTPINETVFSVHCYFCTVVPGGVPSTVQRFVHAASTGTWTRSLHGYPMLFDAALSLDERDLWVLTATDLRRVDARTMATLETILLPESPGGTSRQLALTNDGLVIVHSLRKAWSIHEQKFVPVAWLMYDSDVASSRDGSRAMFGYPTNDGSVPYRYYDVSTGTLVTSITRQHYSRGLYTRHAERALVNSYLLDRDLAMLFSLPVASHSGDLSPDGMRAYGVSYGNTSDTLDTYDLSGAPPYPKIASVDVGRVGAARVATDPSGDFVYVVGEHLFVVVDVR